MSSTSKYKVGERVVFWPCTHDDNLFGNLKSFSKTNREYFKILNIQYEHSSANGGLAYLIEREEDLPTSYHYQYRCEPFWVRESLLASASWADKFIDKWIEITDFKEEIIYFK